MPSTQHLFTLPLLDSNENWAALWLEWIGDAASREAELPGLIAQLRQTSLGQQQPIFLPLGTDSLEAPWIAALPTECSPLLAHPGKNGSLAALESFRDAQRATGHKVGLMVEPDQALPQTGAWDFVVLAVSHARTLPPFTLMGLSSRTTLIASGVRNRADFAWAAGNHCALTSAAYLFTAIAPTGKPDMHRVRLLKLLSLIIEDADTPEIEEIFRQESKLSYSLLRLVNSAAMAPRSPITSFAQAISILGRRQLQRWLQLLVYAAPEGIAANPLLIHAAARGRLMEILSLRINGLPGHYQLPDAAFMVGSFSLLDVMLNMPMREILSQLPLPDDMRIALADHEGTLGTLLDALCAVDLHDLHRASKLLAQLGIDNSTWAESQREALNWATGVNQASS